MIARLWHGKVLGAIGLPRIPAVNRTKGLCYDTRYRSVSLLKKEEQDITDFCTLTYWNSTEDVKQFAGEDVEKARSYPADKDFLLEPLVVHNEVLEHQPLK